MSLDWTEISYIFFSLRPVCLFIYIFTVCLNYPHQLRPTQGVKWPVRELVLRSRKRGSIHPLPIRLHGIALTYLSTGTTLPFTQHI
jgi:hypothetical protein